VYKPGRTGPRGSVNFALVGTGYAKVYVYAGVRFAHADPFFRAQNRARRAGRGLWGAPCHGDTDRPDRRGAAAPPSVAPGGSAGASGPGCDPNYSGACVPVTSGDLDCADVGAPVRVTGEDRHRLDGDGDGRGCESY
jgi:hypothetical protein